jgi:uncharacterized protein (TIGR04255 family)
MSEYVPIDHHPIIAVPARHYDRAPIIEALIDIRCEFPAPPSVEKWIVVEAPLRAKYPVREELMMSQIQMIPPQGNPAATHAAAGFRLLSSDRHRIVSVGFGGFTFSWLAPYDRWESLRAEAFDAWRAYLDLLRPTRIGRVGVRFINRIDVPNVNPEGIELDHYFRTAPRIAPELPQQLASFFMRFQLKTKYKNGSLVITETGAAPPVPNVVSIVLDIDAFVEGDPEFTPEEAWNRIDGLRHEKNGAFEACITDRVRDLIS